MDEARGIACAGQRGRGTACAGRLEQVRRPPVPTRYGHLSHAIESRESVRVST